MAAKILTRAATRAGAVALSVFLAAAAAHADVHFGMISTIRTSPKTTASINIASEQPGEVNFTVFPPGAFEVSDSVGTSLQGFATSADSTNPAIQNLFAGSAATTALVRAVFANGRSSAVLEQSSPDGNVVLDLPPVGVARGFKFEIPIGNLRQGTSVIVGNPSDQETALIVRYGNQPEEPPRPLARFSTLVIDVTQANTLMAILSENQGVLVIAQLAVDTGKTTVMTPLMPTSAGQ